MINALSDSIRRDGFAFAPAAGFRALLGPAGGPAEWDAFAASWNRLALDTHLPEGHTYRRRRHATFSARGGEDFRREPHRAHYQGAEYNKLVGGIERWFEPIEDKVASGGTFGAVVRLGLRLYGALRHATAWHIEAHQFRIEARPDAAGLPTPEGVHRDGVDYVTVMLVNRVNIASGTTTMHALDGRELGSFTLAEPCDAALVDDARVMHGVTPVRPLDPGRPAWRDVIVVTYRETSPATSPRPSAPST